MLTIYYQQKWQLILTMRRWENKNSYNGDDGDDGDVRDDGDDGDNGDNVNVGWECMRFDIKKK